MEEQVLEYWNSHNIFQKSLKQRAGNEEFIFYDGPPFANGLPHYGHLLTGYVKDVIPRFYTMNGYLVNRRFGWDCHGLPAELEAEKQLGITDKSEIDNMGLAEFNEFCRNSVLKYVDLWREYINRQGRWVDMDNDYKTMDLNYMESVIWAFKELYQKGLIYQGFRVVPYSWYEQTSMSNNETRLDDSYRLRQDPALTVAFPIDVKKKSKLYGVKLLVWTTTPWTLPSNLAVGVNPTADYIVVKRGKEKYLLAAERVAAYQSEFGDNPTILAHYKGDELVNLPYKPPFNFFLGQENAHKILAADFVTLDSGTGLVHLAPAFGEDDLEVAKENDISIVQPLDAAGKFTDMVPDYAGMQVFDANPVIIKDLKKAGLVLRHETIEHSYPHSWRSGKPLIYMAQPAWFLAVSKVREALVKNNEKIDWIPSHIKDGQFGKWLAGAIDWNISRTRYWGTPLPVWMSDNPDFPRIDVYGSLDELEKDFGKRPTDLHRPYIDELVRPNPDDPSGKTMMRRVPDILDGWFDSGSMPFAQQHYPFENQETFEANFPGDFVVEYIAQTRGWFYTMHVLSTILFDKPAFRRVVAHGVVLAEDGQKMSKSKRNYVDVNEIFNNYGSDAMRWFLMSSPVLSGGNLVVNESGIKEGIRQAILPLWNSFSFLRLYTEKTAAWSANSTHILDKYILAKLAECRNKITDYLTKADLPNATVVLRDFLEVLTNWYIRRSRGRFWEGQDKNSDAFNTLYTVLEITTRIAAPLLPFTSEAIWRGLTGGRSIHLTDWPGEYLLDYDPELAKEMDEVREICSVTSSIRKKNNLRVRLPLAKLTVVHNDAQNLQKYRQIIQEETNVKEVIFSDELSAYAKTSLTVNAKVLGPRIGNKVQEVIKAVKQGDWQETTGQKAEKIVKVLGIELSPEEYNLTLVTDNPGNTGLLNTGSGLVILDTKLTPDLEMEGWAKDRIRELQKARKDMNFDVSDRIKVKVWVSEDRIDWLQKQRELIMSEVLATSFDVQDTKSDLQELSPNFYVYLEKT